MGTITVNSDLEKLFGNRLKGRDNYFTIEAVTSGSITFEVVEYFNYEIYCAKNEEDWELIKYDGETYTKVISLADGDKLHFKGNKEDSFSYLFTISEDFSFNVMGYLSSLFKGDNYKTDNNFSGNFTMCFSSFFNSTKIIDASNLILPNNIVDNCYESMFRNCTNLTKAPKLPATTLARGCYQNMFNGCTSLTTAPELPATTLASDCYNNMFTDCTSLVAVPKILPATTLEANCYALMFKGCTNLSNCPQLPAVTLKDYCYGRMFEGTNAIPDCSNIDFSSETVVASGGLRGLFQGTKVADADLMKILPINESSGKYWLPVTTLTNRCYEGMFSSCTSLTTAPELPATTLKNYCYSDMFSGCTSLNYIKAMFTTTPSTSYASGTSDWVRGVSPIGTFVKNSAATWNVTGDNGVPTGWTIQTVSA